MSFHTKAQFCYMKHEKTYVFPEISFSLRKFLTEKYSKIDFFPFFSFFYMVESSYKNNQNVSTLMLCQMIIFQRQPDKITIFNYLQYF